MDQNLSITNFVEEIISKAVEEIQEEDSTSKTCDQLRCPVDSTQNTSPVKLKDSSTAVTPTKFVSSGTSPIKLKLTENETSMTPVVKIHSTTSVTPVGTADAMLATSPVCLKDAIISTSPFCETDSTTNTSHICSLDQEHEPFPGSECGNSSQDQNNTEPSFDRGEETAVASMKPDQDFENLHVSPQKEAFGTPLSPVHQTEGAISIEENTSYNALKESFVDTGTSMTPVTLIDKHTLVSPVQTSSVSITTSPLVAALHPDIISSLPLSRLRSELESAAISNELLRSECDDLNTKIESLQSFVDEAKSEAQRKSSSTQNVIDSLTKKLKEALELNHEMEMKKVKSSSYFCLF